MTQLNDYVEALTAWNVSRIKGLIVDCKVDINQQDSSGCSALHYAALKNDSEFVSWLLDHGADVELQDDNGRTALAAALCVGSSVPQIPLVPILKLIPYVDLHQINLEGPNGLQRSYLHIILDRLGYWKWFELNRTARNLDTQNNQKTLIEIFDVFLAAGADVNLRNHDEESPIQMAIRSGNLFMAQKMDRYGVNWQQAESLSQGSLMHVAIRSKNLKMMDWVAGHPIDLARRDENGCGLLIAAIKSCNGNDTHLLKFLLEKCPLDIHEQDADGHTALHYAAIYRSCELAQFLIENGVDLFKKDDHDRTALDMARLVHQSEVLSYLEGIYSAKQEQLELQESVSELSPPNPIESRAPRKAL